MSKRNDGHARGKYALEFKLEAVRLVGAFDDKAEIQKFGPTNLKPILTIACQHHWSP